MFGRSHDSDNLQVPLLAAIRHADDFPERVLAGPKTVRQCLIDDDDRTAVSVIAREKIPPAAQRDSHRLEKILEDEAVRGTQGLRWFGGRAVGAREFRTRV